MAITDPTPKERHTPDHSAELLKALAAPIPSHCPVTLDQINEYVVAQLASENTAEWFITLSLHLPLCPTCLSVYTRLYRASVAEKSGRLTQAHPDRRFDISFLDTAAPTLFEQVQAALHQIGNIISLQLSTALLQGLTPAPALSVRGQSGEALLMLEPDETLRQTWPATIHVYRDARQPDQCMVKVQVKPIGRPFPHRKGIQVSLQNATDQWRANTDAYGNALLTDIPIAKLASLKIELAL